MMCMSSLFISTALCPDLSNPTNGTVTVMGTSVGDTASYTCNDGFELIGSMSVTCTSDGTWSDEPPMCGRKQSTILAVSSSMMCMSSLFILYSPMS